MREDSERTDLRKEETNKQTPKNKQTNNNQTTKPNLTEARISENTGGA